LEYFKSISLL